MARSRASCTRFGENCIRQSRPTFDLYTSLGPVHVAVMEHPSQDNFMADLQDATVRVRGVVGEVFNSRKQLVGLQLAVENMRGIEVIEPGSSNPFARTRDVHH
jgi:hypothetical protein